MKLVVFVLLLFISVSNIRAQKSIQKWVLVDSLDCQIPFSHIYFKLAKIGTTTDSLGNFTLSNELLQANKVDTLVFSCIGYKGKNIAVTDLLKKKGSRKIVLVPSFNIIEEVSIKPYKQKDIVVGYINCKSSALSMQGFFGKCLIVKIENQNRLSNRIIKTVSFQVSNDKSNVNANLRLRFFAFKNNRFELLPYFKDNPIIVSDFSKRKVDIDISTYRIPFNEEGIYVGLEWIAKSDVFKSTIEECSPGIRCTSSVKNSNTYYLNLHTMESFVFPSLSDEEKNNIPKVFFKKIMNSNAKIGLTVM